MDRLVRARVLLAEAAALGVTIEDLIAQSAGSPYSPSMAPTVAEFVETVRASFSKGTADTYQSYWRLAVARLGCRPIDSIGVADCEAVVADSVARARRNRPGTDGRSAPRELHRRAACPLRPGRTCRTRRQKPGRPSGEAASLAQPTFAPSKTTSCERS